MLLLIFLYSVVLIILGLIMLLNPLSLWKFEKFLTTKEGEPSSFYRPKMAFLGIIALFFGIGLLILVLVNYF